MIPFFLPCQKQVDRRQGKKNPNSLSRMKAIIAEAIEDSIKPIKTSTYRITTSALVSLGKTIEDFKTTHLPGTIRYSASRKHTRFILTTNNDQKVPREITINNRTYFIKPYQESVRTALATIYNIPYGMNPVVSAWLAKLGNIVEESLPNNSTISNGKGSVKFS